MKKKHLAALLVAIFIISALPVSAGFAVNGQTSPSVVKAEQWKRRQPDLTLTSKDIIFSPASPTEGETVTITATIHNDGEGWAWRVEVGFYDGESPVDIKKTGLIKAGGTGTASIEWTATLGEHLIRVVADPNNKISESNEDNNEASKTITISGVGVLIPDLTLTPADIAFTPGAPTEGETVTITATILNMGNGTASDVVVGFWLDGDPATGTSIGDDTIASVAAGGSESASVVWTAVIGDYVIYVVADPDDTIPELDEDNNQASKSISVAEAPPTPPYDYELFIEIDYVGDHEPTQTVLEYIEWYYYGNNPTGDVINVTFYVENVTIAVIDLGVNYQDGINDDEFWAIEKAVNNLGDDDYGVVDPIFGTDGVYSSKWKWVLFGTAVEGQPSVVGYCYIVRQRVRWQWDLLAGNYMFIADETADDWATDNGIETYGAEAVVLMHEMGHSIGIAKLDWRGREVYDPDPGSVMSYLSTANGKLYGTWYYSDEYWATRNMEYYVV